MDVSQEGMAGLDLIEKSSRFKVRLIKTYPAVLAGVMDGQWEKVPSAARCNIGVPKFNLGTRRAKNLLRLGHLGFGQAGLDDPPGQGGGFGAAVAAVLHQDCYGHLGVVGRGVGHEPGVIFLAPGLLLFGIIPIDGDHLGRAGFAGHLDVGPGGRPWPCRR